MRIRAFILGVRDGFAQPHDLSTGISWDNMDLNESYDRGTILGQKVRSPLNNQSKLEGYTVLPRRKRA